MARACAAARSPCSTGSTPSPRPTRRRSPPSASPTSCAAASGSSNGPRSSRRCCCCGAPRGPSEATGAGVPGEVGDVLAATGWDPAEPPAGGAARERWESLAALVRLAEEFVASRPERHAAEPWSAELDERAAAQHAPTVEGVTLASLHAAKGLEWDAVFLVGLVDGMVPIVHAQTDGGGRGGAAAALRRRHPSPGAPDAVVGLGPQPGGSRSRQPSRFLDGLRPGEAPGATGRPPRSRGTRRQGREPRPARGALPDLPATADQRGRSASAAGATTARPTTTRPSTTCSRAGARPVAGRLRARPTSSSPTRRSRRSPCASRRRVPSWRRSAGSAR